MLSSNPTHRWLSIIGMGEDGVEGLSAAARALVEGAEIVYGGKRHLQLAASLIQGEARPWPSPLDSAYADIAALRGRRICVLASGDPSFFGVGAVLARHIPAEEILTLPGISAFSLAAARLGWALQDTALVSLHGRPLDLIRPHLHPGARVLALTSDEHGPAALARLLSETGFGETRFTVLEALGGPNERITGHKAESFSQESINPLNIVALEIHAAPGARILARAPGLPDDLFEHDGQITKREIRAVTLSALAPQAGELLWDVGAGSGSISIEWMLAHPSLRAVAVEAREDRAARITRNAVAFGVPDLRVVQARAPEALAGLPQPDAIFLGGGASAEVLDHLLEALAPGGRLVANAVTLETEALLLAAHARHGGELIRLNVARAEPIAGRTGWRAAMPVTQWAWVKP